MRGLALIVLAACGTHAGTHAPDASSDHDAAPAPDAPSAHVSNRDRLLATYHAFIAQQPDTPLSNGLLPRNLHSVCDVWSALDPSARAVFLTITDRLDRSLLADGTHALDHVTKLYRVIGGQGATTTSPGSCGGGEYNRLILSQDAALHAAQLAANSRQGAMPYDLADVLPSSAWRDSHDLAGPHAPFDLSDETTAGAPRGQTQYFKDPASAAANAPLGRMDLATLVDPYALEIDQDYDCTHNSNPACEYTLYGPACAPQTTQPGTAIYTQTYGDFGAAWKPSGC